MIFFYRLFYQVVYLREPPMPRDGLFFSRYPARNSTGSDGRSRTCKFIFEKTVCV